MALTNQELKELAARGIRQEIARLNTLLAQVDGTKRVQTSQQRAANGEAHIRRRRGMSKAARQATSERMKAYWAKRRKGK